MFSLDNIVINSVYEACYKMGAFFGFGVEEGLFLYIIFIGCAISFLLGGGKKRVR